MLKDTGEVKPPIGVATFCSGIGAVECALSGEPGWKILAMAEIEPHPCAVLKKHYPDVPNYGDITKIKGSDLPPGIGVMVAGTPCQSFSVAGLRLGLDDARGNLTFEYLRIANEYQQHYKTKVQIVWENVPGVFSDAGNAFGEFIAALAGGDAAAEPGPRPPVGKSNKYWRWDRKRKRHVPKWPVAGWLAGPERTIAWCVKDAQFFGLAQRRKRVFVVASPCDGPNPRPVLFESGRRCRDTPPSRETGQDVAGTLESSFGRSRGAGTPPGAVVNALTKRAGQGAPDDNRALAGSYVALGGGNTSGAIDIAPYLGCNESGSGYRNDFESEAFVVAGTLTYGKKAAGSVTQQDAHAGLLVPVVTSTLRAEGFDASEDGTGRQNLVVGFDVYNQSSTGNIAQSLCSRGDTPGGNGGGLNTVPSVLHKSAVRRLMPIECERLQGFPDNYTALKDWKSWRDVDESESIDKLKEQGYKVRQTKGGKWRVNDPDGPRYKALGNSMAVPVMRWILRRVGTAIRLAHEQHMRTGEGV